MTFYEFTSTLLTIIGYSVIVYRIIFELYLKKTQQEKLCTKWLIFNIFSRQCTICSPSSRQYLSAHCSFSFLSYFCFCLKMLYSNQISHQIYKRIQKHFQRVKLEEYNSAFVIALSWICTNTVAILMKLICKIAAFIDLKHIEDVQKHILQIIKVLQYKKAAINIKYQTQASEARGQLNSLSFNISINEQPVLPQAGNAKKFVKSEISNQISKVLDFDLQDEQIKFKADQMIIKPNKQTGQKAKFSQVEVEYYLKTSKITFKNKHGAGQSKTLKQIRWITKNMMKIQTIFKDGESKILKVKNYIDVARWIQPVCMNLQTIKDQLA